MAVLVPDDASTDECQLVLWHFQGPAGARGGLIGER
jgi:hypothetical protein